MEYEQDYLMRMIKQMVKELVSFLLGKEYHTYELPIEEKYQYKKHKSQCSLSALATERSVGCNMCRGTRLILQATIKRVSLE